MAVIDPVASRPASGVRVFTWEAITEADTAASLLANGTEPLAGSLHLVGTFGGATFTLQGSNDNTNWVTLEDVNGDSATLSATGVIEFSTALVYLRVGVSGGSGTDVDAFLALRG